MRVLFDQSPAVFVSGGTRTYTNQIFAALQRTKVSTLQVQTARLPAWLYPDRHKNLMHKLRVLGWDSLYQHLLLPASAIKGADLIHTPTARLPALASVPVVATILDVIPRYFPQYYRLHDALVLNLYLRLSTRRASHIITISECSRQDLHRSFGVSLDHITVTHLAPAPTMRPIPSLEMAATLARYGIVQPYILSVCTVEPRKNLQRLLHAFATLRQQGAISHQLVLVGSDGWLPIPITATAAQLGVGDAVQLLGYIPDADLPALYTGADLFAYVPIYEGFGLPPLEAMACGTPVLTSNNSSLPEVVGDAAIMVDPLSISQIAKAMGELLTSAEQHERLRIMGLRRSRDFSWMRCAAETIEVYHSVLARSR